MPPSPTLVLTVRFLQPFSHGRGHDGRPEWPPSPLRLFQAMTASGLGKPESASARAEAEAALEWLETLAPPEIVATDPARNGDGLPRTTAYRGYVPNNLDDKAASKWRHGHEATLGESRTEKDVRALLFSSEGSDPVTVSYVYDCGSEAIAAHVSALRRTMRSVTHLGWGIDQVVGDASVDDASLRGTRWIPKRSGSATLRTPVRGTLAALEERHRSFLGRLPGNDLFLPVPPLATFERVRYARADALATRPWIAFRLVEPGTRDRLAFDAARRTRDVAAWVRHKVGEAAAGWPFGDAAELVHGHAPAGVAPSLPDMRLRYLPLPTLAPKRKGGSPWAMDIARVLICAPSSKERELAWLEEDLAGRELEWQGGVMAELEHLPDDDAVLGWYVGPETGARSWTTVTPVVLPGHDDRSRAKTEKLLRRSLRHSGFTAQIADSAQVEWSKTGFFPGVQHADRYAVPDELTGARYHVRLLFATPVRGPISVGSGRFRGVGTFVHASA